MPCLLLFLPAERLDFMNAYAMEHMLEALTSHERLVLEFAVRVAVFVGQCFDEPYSKEIADRFGVRH